MSRVRLFGQCTSTLFQSFPRQRGQQCFLFLFFLLFILLYFQIVLVERRKGISVVAMPIVQCQIYFLSDHEIAQYSTDSNHLGIFSNRSGVPTPVPGSFFSFGPRLCHQAHRPINQTKPNSIKCLKRIKNAIFCIFGCLPKVQNIYG